MKKYKFQKNFLYNFQLVLLPIFLFVTGCILREAHGPYYLWRFDQSYAYLINSLNLAQLLEVGGVAHPGTPVQIIGAIVFKIAYYLSGAQTDFVKHVLTNPEAYLLIFQRILLILNSLVLLLLGLLTFKISKNLLLSLFIQFSVFVSFWIFYCLMIVIADQFLILTSLCLIGISTFYLFKLNDNKIPLGFFIITAFICGIGLSSKLNFAPMLFIPFIIIKGIKNKMKFVVFTMLFFLILLLPLISQLEFLIEWIKNLLIYDGTFGKGEPDIINLTTFKENISSIFRQDLFFAFAYVFSIVTLTFSFVSKRNRTVNQFTYKSQKLLVAIFISFSLQIALVAKHYAPYYMVPSIVLSNLSLVLCIVILGNLFQFKLRTQNILYVTFILINCMYGIYTFNSLYEMLIWNRQEALRTETYMRINHSNDIVISSFGSASLDCAIAFSSSCSGRQREKYKRIMTDLLTNQIFYNPWTYKLYPICDDQEIENILKRNNRLIFHVRGENMLDIFTRELGKVNNIKIKESKELFRNDNGEFIYEIKYEI